VIDLRSQAHRHDELLRERLDRLIPALLAETGVSCWVVMGREYAEDQVLLSMLPATWLSARRRTILVLTATDRLSISRYPVDDLFTAAWDPAEEPNQWKGLAAVLADLDPETIGIGLAPDHAHADGVTTTEHAAMMAAMPPRLRDRFVSADTLAVRWLESRLPIERTAFEEAAAVAHGILRRGLSREVIEPGTTTTDDLAWWYRNCVADAGLTSWFHPTVSVQRAGDATDHDPETLIGGDLIHVDFGIRRLGLCTDQQEHAYVTLAGEPSAPQGLCEGMAVANRAQDLVLAALHTGLTGNEILASAHRACSDADIEVAIYSHAIGVNGHGAGITIGLWDAQDGVPGAGEHPLHPNTAISLELMATHHVAEWDRPVRFMVEQDVWFDGRKADYLDGRQTDLWII
jgi:Xaa-Pro aminopeptidase